MSNKADIDYQKNCLLVAGELNFATVVRLWNESLPKLAQYPELQFDLGQVTFSNSAGLALLLEWMKYAERVKKRIRFSNVPKHLQSIISVAGLVEMLG